ncbi:MULTISPECIES: DsbA family protein [unclassified Roseovarius]|uniref:DsbA family protein n=1 Tax=unclassified Roseovarius TaxID=2614913 RepID=UPI00273ED787|nr:MULTISPECIES: DsbA family protein [unclassified Roseovarius]
MKRPLLTAAAFTTMLALPAQALDLDQMSEAERAAFRAEIRAYLLENPEVIMEAVDVLEKRQQQARAQDDTDLVKVNAEDIFNDGHSWVGGNPDGDITLVEFMDYRCGYCRRAFDEVETLLESDGNIRFIVKEFPILGEESTLASRFAIATQQVAGDEAYKSVHDTLMAFNGAINEASLSRIADSLGLDPHAITAHMNSDEVTKVIAENHDLAQRLSISGTPSFVMANHMLRGYLPAEDMQRMADEIRTQ